MSDPAASLRVYRQDLWEPLLERVTNALAARVDLPVDRLADAQLVASVLAVAARRRLPAIALTVELTAAPRAIGMAIGPLPGGEAERLLEESRVGTLGSVLERLTDARRIERLADGDERLELVIGAPAPSRR